MSNSQPPASGTRQKSISQGMPPGDPAQRAQVNNVPLGQVPLSQNLLIGGSQAAPQGAPQQPQQPQQANPMTAAIAQHLQSLPPGKLAREADRADYMVHAYGTLARKPNLTMKDVISQAGQAVADGKATPEEATQEVTSLPQDPTALRTALQQRFKTMIISAAMLSGVKPANPAQPVGGLS